MHLELEPCHLRAEMSLIAIPSTRFIITMLITMRKIPKST
jgi:hypothetical protein